MADLTVVNGLVVLPGAEPRPLDIAVSGGRVEALHRRGEAPRAAEVIDASGLHVMPGVIDPHIHLGGYQPLETDAGPGTGLAAVGGVTTLVNYFKHNGSYLDLLPELIATYEREAHVDAAFHLQLLTEPQLQEVAALARDFGVTSYKINLVWKGRERQVFGTDRPIDNGWVWSVMERLAEVGRERMVLNVHCENQEIKNEAVRRLEGGMRPTLEYYESLAPDIAETDSVLAMMSLHRRTRVRTYLVHLSSKLTCEALGLSWARSDGLHKETCIHYLAHTVDSPAGLLATVSPPVRRAEDREALWSAVADGTIQVVGSDANPILRSAKMGTGDFWKVKPGFDGVGQILPVMLSLGHHDRGIPLGRIAEVLSESAARIFGLYPKKGGIVPGGDADLVLVDLDKRRRVGAEAVAEHCDFSIYEGMELRGWPVMTISRGEVVARDGRLVSRGGRGRYLPREA